MIKRTKTNQKKVNASLSLPTYGKSGTIIARRFMIRAKYLAIHNSGVRQAIAAILSAEDAARILATVAAKKVQS